ncbi:serine hydrolase domain-containing protein [Gaopeijia maritima]
MRRRAVIEGWASVVVAWTTGLGMAIPAAGQMPADSAIATYERAVRQRLDSNNIPGASIAVVRGGEIVYQRSFGLADVELGVPVTDSTVFEIGSVSKQFVAAAAVLIEEEGRLDLDAPIHTVLGWLPGEWRGATIRQLLTHTSGIPDYEAIAGYRVYDRRATASEIVAIAQSRPVDFPPGEGFEYSNTGYYLLSLILEAVEGESIGRVLDRRIFAPLGMRSTRMADPESIIPHRAKGYYQDRNRTLINIPPSQPSATLGAGGLVSTVHDLARWDAALRGTTLLSEAAKARIWAPTALPDGRAIDYGFGWRVEPYGEHRQQYHYGMTHGFIANLTRLPDADLTVIALANRYREDLGRIVVPTLDLFLEAGG